APLVVGGAGAAALFVAGLAFEPLPVGPAVPLVAVAGGVAAMGVVAAVAFLVAARLGFGPLAAIPGERVPPDARPTPPPEGWLGLGSGFGLPVVWLGVSLVASPLAVYIVSYVPWALIDNHRLWEGLPAGHTGQTLLA